MAAAQRDSEGATSLQGLPKDSAYDAGAGTTLREQEGGEEPARTGAEHSHVIRVDVDGIPAQAIRSQRDRIRFRHQIASAHLDHGGVLAVARSEHYPRRPRRRTGGKQRFEQAGRQFAYWNYP